MRGRRGASGSEALVESVPCSREASIRRRTAGGRSRAEVETLAIPSGVAPLHPEKVRFRARSATIAPCCLRLTGVPFGGLGMTFPCCMCLMATPYTILYLPGVRTCVFLSVLNLCRATVGTSLPGSPGSDSFSRGESRP
ncbi:uncharacterized protein BO80DRAFT_150563 [Aspergillus ibericus CBS 121593]|uniref:Uncharacterized protein n=1 Tax=Aspergillus ibericus CBS 121593 TaxID=1448316 RepID=A0A395GUW5_9EURO|nr:hypothetical protein BO80DRAFT_150563 [Aspergillus ibericus CBS 121593]RAK98964.1 hypothetical protein BO80DRAFT_150563 [Aspergillus ibericus CBS 121593]